MIGLARQEALIGEIVGASQHAISLEDMGAEILPLIERAFETSASVIYRCREPGVIENFAGTLGDEQLYSRELYLEDPMQSAMRRENPHIFHGSRYPEWGEFRERPVRDYFLGCEMDDYLHVRLSDTDHHAPGMVALVIARSPRQRPFSEADLLLLARVLPSLVALTSRNTRVEAERRARAAIEALAELDTRPRMMLDTRGRLLWASDRARGVLGARSPLPASLIEAALRLVAEGDTRAARVSLARAGRERLRAELRLVRTSTGAAFVAIELDDARPSPFLAELAARGQLTDAESEVLSLLARGFSDREIARRRFVSLATVHTQVAHVLAKLGVRSRVHVVLLAVGAVPESDVD